MRLSHECASDDDFTHPIYLALFLSFFMKISQNAYLMP